MALVNTRSCTLAKGNGMTTVAKSPVRIDPGLFIKEFNNLARHKHRYEVFRDFVTVGALSVHNSIRGPRYEELEAEYLQIRARYTAEEAEGFAKLLGILVALLDAEPRDILGQLYMNLELGNTHTGQFFTPPEISELMARITFGDGAEHADKPFITLCEPACGAGGMVLAFVKVMLEKGWNPVERVWVQAQDLDRTAALMCYLQLALWHVPAAIVVGNTLMMEASEVFYTPAHHLGFWDNKLRRAEREREAAQLMRSTAVEEVQDLVATPELVQTSSAPMATMQPKPMPAPGADGTQVQFDFEF
jgi:hypothetical protein